MTRTPISNSDNVIDSRDVIKRIDELTEARDTAIANEEEFDKEDELKALIALADEASGYAADWTHGETLIADDYFETYAEELAGDTGCIDPKAKWPLTHIDWEAAANELKQDYTSVDFDGVTYWIC